MNLADLSRPRVLTWHVHGSYLYYLAHTPALFILPVKDGRPEGYGGRGGNFAWPENVVEVPASEIPDTDFDLVLFQSKRNYLRDQFNILTLASGGCRGSSSSTTRGSNHRRTRATSWTTRTRCWCT